MDCPSCEAVLERTQYEGHQVFQCSRCHGYLVEKRKLAHIKGSREQTAQALADEAAAELQPDSPARLRCPKCLARRMSKERVVVQPSGEEFAIDVCRHCQVAWFDGGELARFQLDYEATAKALDELAVREQGDEASQERARQFEENLARLPEFHASPWSAAWRAIALVAAAVVVLAAINWGLYSWGASPVTLALVTLALVGLGGLLLYALGRHD